MLAATFVDTESTNATKYGYNWSVIKWIYAKCGSRYQYIFTWVLQTCTYKQIRLSSVSVSSSSDLSQTNVLVH